MRELADAKNQAETLLYTTEKTLKEHRDAVDDETISTIESSGSASCGRRSRATTRARSARSPSR